MTGTFFTTVFAILVALLLWNVVVPVFIAVFIFFGEYIAIGVVFIWALLTWPFRFTMGMIEKAKKMIKKEEEDENDGR